MRRNTKAALSVLAVTSGVFLATIGAGAMLPGGASTAAEGGRKTAESAGKGLVSLAEARGRAELLHETIHATLQIVHREYYREDEGLPIPSHTLETVFDELARSRNINLRWLVVDAQAMNIDHNPQDEFEKNAVKALKSGKKQFDLVEKGVYRHAGVITLSSQCLKCHVPNRTSTKDRTAGLVISMPVREK